MLCYYDNAHGTGLIVAANRSLTTDLSFCPALEHPAAMLVGDRVEVVYDAHGLCRRSMASGDSILLRPCEVLVMETGT